MQNFQENVLLVQLTFKAEFCGRHTRARIHFLQASILKNLWKVRNLTPRGYSKARSRFLSLALNFFPPRWNTGSQFRVASKFSHFRGPMLLLSSTHRAQFLIPTQKYSSQRTKMTLDLSGVISLPEGLLFKESFPFLPLMWMVCVCVCAHAGNKYARKKNPVSHSDVPQPHPVSREDNFASGSYQSPSSPSLRVSQNNHDFIWQITPQLTSQDWRIWK